MKNGAILTEALLKMLRCGVVPESLSEEYRDLAELSICAYSDGKEGADYIPVEKDQNFPTWAAECLDRFLRAAHEQGQEDAEEKVHG